MKSAKKIQTIDQEPLIGRIHSAWLQLLRRMKVFPRCYLYQPDREKQIPPGSAPLLSVRMKLMLNIDEKIKLQFVVDTLFY